MTRSRARLVGFTLFVSLLATACGGSEAATAEPVDVAAAEPETAVEVADDDAEIGSAEPSTALAAAPELMPGTMTTSTVTIDGVDIDFAAVVPVDFEVGGTAPVLLAMPPGGQSLDLTANVTSGTYATQALARGWVVVSPAAPESGLYFNGSETLIPGFVDWINTWVTPEGGRPHLAGISNGGISSFRVAGNEPDAFASMIVFPGFPRSAEDQAALAELADIPIRMFVGETDTSWIPPMEEAFATLDGLGADVALDIRVGEGHVMASLSDGADIFDLLDSFR